MDDKILLPIFSGIAFVVSACFTIILMMSNASSIPGIILMFLTALCLEFAKYKTFHKSIYQKCLKSLILGFLLLLVSVVASVSLMFNQINDVKMETKRGSKEYTIKMETIRRKSELYDKKMEEAGKLSDRYRTRRNNLLNEAKELANEIENVDINNLQTLDNKSVSAFMRFCTNQINITFKSKLNSDHTELLFFGFLAVLFEVSAVWLLNETKKLKPIESVKVEKVVEKTEPIIEPKPVIKPVAKVEPKPVKKAVEKQDQTLEIKEKPIEKLSDVDFSNKSFTKKEVMKYLKEMYKQQKDGFSIGYKKLCDFIKANDENMELPYSKGLRIKLFIESLGIIKPEGNKTKIVKFIKV